MAYPTTTEHHKLYPYTSIMASPYSCDPTGVVDIAASIESLKANQSNVGTIYFPHGTYKLATNLTIPSGMEIVREAGSTISIATGVTLTIGCSISGPESQFFLQTGTAAVVFQSTFKQDIEAVWFSSLANAVAAASTNNHTIRVARGVWPVTANLAVPATSTLKVDKGGDIQIATGIILTINGPFEAGLYQMFSCTGTGAVSFGAGAIDFARWEWWGTNATALQAAFIACPQIRLAQNASYTLDFATIGSIYLNNSGNVWRYKLMGSGNTVLNLTNYADTGIGTATEYVFTMNQTSGGVQVASSVAHPRFVIEDLKIDGAGSTGGKFLFTNFAAPVFNRVEFRNMKQGAYTSTYTDLPQFINCKWYTPVAGGHLYKSTLAGDGFYARNVIALDVDVFYLMNCQGGALDSCIGGHHQFVNCGAINVRSGHFEFADANQIIAVRNSDVTVEDSYLRSDGTYYPLYLDDDATVERVSNVVLKNNTFHKNMADASATIYPIRINNILNGSTLRVENCRARAYIVDVSDNDPYRFQDLGFRASAVDATLNTLLGTWYYMFGKNWELKYTKGAWRIFSPPGNNELDIYALNTPIVALAEETIPGLTGALAAGTYYYRVDLQGDGFRKSIGSVEQTIIKAADGSVVKITITGAQPHTVAYVHRSIVSATYTGAGAYYSRIPLTTETVVLYDRGGSISAHAWEVGVAVTATATAYNGKYVVETGNRICRGTGNSPAAGTWIAGDIWQRTDPATGNPGQSHCTVGGTPGTWLGVNLP